MKAAVTDGKGSIALHDVPVPEPGQYQCLCKILACATCTGTDHKIINNALPWKMEYPAVLGHESFGRVVKTGKKVRCIKEGDLFLRPAAIYPGEKRNDLYSAWGGFAEYGLITDVRALKEDTPDAQPNGYTVFQQQIPVGLTISPADATMLIMLKETASFLMTLGVTLNDPVAILGSGAVAMAYCRFAKILGAFPVIVVGRRDKPAEIMKKAGADAYVNNAREDMAARIRQLTDGRGVKYVVDTTGDLGLITAAAGILAEKGTIAPYATSPSFTYMVERMKGPGCWNFLFIGPDEPRANQYVLDGVRLKFVQPDLFYSHRMPFADIKKGFDLIDRKQAYKIVFEME